MSHYYCNCRDTERKVKEGRSKFEKTEVDYDGVCANCGYYAVSTREEVTAKNELYYMTVGYKDAGEEKLNKDNERRRKARKNKESDLDTQ